MGISLDDPDVLIAIVQLVSLSYLLHNLINLTIAFFSNFPVIVELEFKKYSNAILFFSYICLKKITQYELR